MSTLEKVALFQQAFGIQTEAEIRGTPSLPPMNARWRAHLFELSQGLRVVANNALRHAAELRKVDDPAYHIFLRVQLMVEEEAEVVEAMASGDVTATAHELADLDYVVMGTILCLGLGSVHNRIVDEIHRANMSKLDSLGHPIVNEAGRVVKGPNFEEADVSGIIEGD